MVPEQRGLRDEFGAEIAGADPTLAGDAPAMARHPA